MWPGPSVNGTLTPDYADFFFAAALQKLAAVAARVGAPGDAERWAAAAADATAHYTASFYNASAGYFADGLYVSCMYGLALGAVPRGSPAEAAVWRRAASYFEPNGALAPYPGAFPGGIVTLKLLWDLIDRFGGGWPGLGVSFLTRTAAPPSLGFWVANGLTALAEEYNMSSAGPPSFYGAASFNHIMFGSGDAWLHRSVAGLARAPGSRSWRALAVAPPVPAAGVVATLDWAATEIDTPMGLVAAGWAAGPGAATAAAAAHAAGSPAHLPPAPARPATLAGAAPSGAPPLFTVTATVPVGGTATVAVPAVSTPESVTVYEGGAAVWAAGAFVPGVPGVAGAAAAAAGDAVVFSVGSGTYTFVVTEGGGGRQAGGRS
jgi:hypothetical protein